MKLTLTIEVEYDPGTTNQRELMGILHDAAFHLAGEGLLTGESDATVEHWKATVSNARAIAALPKVLEALAKNLSFYREMRTGGYCIDCDHEHDVTLQALLEAGYTITES